MCIVIDYADPKPRESFFKKIKKGKKNHVLGVAGA